MIILKGVDFFITFVRFLMIFVRFFMIKCMVSLTYVDTERFICSMEI